MISYKSTQLKANRHINSLAKANYLYNINISYKKGLKSIRLLSPAATANQNRLRTGQREKRRILHKVVGRMTQAIAL